MITFCTQCANRLSTCIPEGDNRPRQVCASCGHIHYENPKVIVGAIAEWDGKILLCKRAIEPRLGYWTLPAGFMENDESAEAGAIREKSEEEGEGIKIAEAFANDGIPHYNPIHLFFRGRMAMPDYNPGLESLDVGLFSEKNVPWDRISFESVKLCLQLFFSNRSKGRYSFHNRILSPV